MATTRHFSAASVAVYAVVTYATVIYAVVTCAMWLLLSCPCAAADEQKAPASRDEKKSATQKVDDELLKDLDNELLEGVGPLKKPTKDAAAPEGKKSDKEEEIEDTEGEGIAQPSESDPLLHISQEMRWVEDLIPKPTKRPLTEQVQQRIIENLNKLIEQAEQQSAAQKSSSSKNSKQQQTAKRKSVQQPKMASKPGKNSNAPAKDSTDRLGQAEAAHPDPELMKSLMKDAWGHLPGHARDQMMQNAPERFVPQYELMIERYFKRLAEEQTSR